MTAAAQRERLPNRRRSIAFKFDHEGHSYRATFSQFEDGRLGEIFLNSGKVGTAAQVNAETTAVLASLLLQHDVTAQAIHKVVLPLIAF